MNEMSINGIYAKGYADGYENGRMSKELVFFPPCQDCNKKMEEVRKAYDYWKAKEYDNISELESLKAEIQHERSKHSGEGKYTYTAGLKVAIDIIDNHIKELNGNS